MVFNTDPVLLNICSDVGVAIIAAVTVPESPVVITVPVTFGMVIVLSAVGSATVKVVSKSPSVDPSKIILTKYKIHHFLFPPVLFFRTKTMFLS